MQYRFKDGEIVDAVIFLDKGQILPVDSKFSLENYNRMINAETKSEREMWLNKVKADLKGELTRLVNTFVRAKTPWTLLLCLSLANLCITIF